MVNHNNMKTTTITISKADIIKADKASRRKSEIEAGAYGMFKNKTFKDKKSYTRKDKYKKSFV